MGGGVSMTRLRGWRDWELTVRRAGLTLAVVAVVVARQERGVDVDRIGDGFAEAVTRENHFGVDVDLICRVWMYGCGKVPDVACLCFVRL